jgi:hypothetical protein
MNNLLVAVVFFLAGLLQSASGFGSALISMPLLAPVLGLGVAAPLVAMMGLALEAVLLAYYRAALGLRIVGRLVGAAMVGIPLGVLATRYIEERAALLVLGLLLVGYSLYALMPLRLPRLHSPLWALLAGFLAGVLGGAYNTAGPPVIIYGHFRRWPPSTFKANLQGFFLVVSAWVVLSHALAGNLTRPTLGFFTLGLGPLALGTALGLRLARHLDGERFRRLVAWLLLALGAQVLWGALA